MSFIRKLFRIREFSIFIIVVLVIIILSFRNPFFATNANFFGIMSSMVTNTIIAGAMTVLFVSGGFDLSVGSTLGLCAMLVVLFLKIGLPIPFAVLLTILTGVSLGSIMGYIISYIGINPFIVTLAGFFIIRSLHLLISGGTSIKGTGEPFTFIASFKILNVPMNIIFAFLSLIIFAILLHNNIFFRKNYYIGGNEVAGSLLGINVKNIKLFNYTLSSGMAAIAGIFLASRFNNANIEGSPNTAFQVITAVILGGASLKGGKGSIIGTFLGLVLLALISNAMVLFGLNILWDRVAIGLVLIFIIVLDSILYKNPSRS